MDVAQAALARGGHVIFVTESSKRRTTEASIPKPGNRLITETGDAKFDRQVFDKSFKFEKCTLYSNFVTHP